MHKIIITSTKFDGSLEFELDDQEMVRLFKNNATLDENQEQWLSENFPITLARLNGMVHNFKSLKAELVEADLSFENFWNTYNYKVGSKARAEKLWNKLTDAVKLKVFSVLPSYEYFLKIKNQEKAYPTTFLNEERYENEFKTSLK